MLKPVRSACAKRVQNLRATIGKKCVHSSPSLFATCLAAGYAWITTLPHTQVIRVISTALSTAKKWAVTSLQQSFIHTIHRPYNHHNQLIKKGI